MKRFFLIISLLLGTAAGAFAQEAGGDSIARRPFEGELFCKETGASIVLNLYEENVSVPNFAFLGKTHGYMSGGIYGTWIIVSHTIEGKKATIRLSNDIGSDSQNIDLEQVNDSTFSYHARGGNAIRRAVGRKLVKVTGEMTFIKK